MVPNKQYKLKNKLPLIVKKKKKNWKTCGCVAMETLSSSVNKLPTAHQFEGNTKY